MFNVNSTYSYDFSIYNNDWNGLSNFRNAIEDSGHEVYSIQTSMSVISRYNGSAVLVIMGPVKDFSIDTVFTIFNHIMAGGRVLIADDFGTANSSFYWLNNYLAGVLGAQLPEGIHGFVSFTGGVLLDLDSYEVSPKLPVIRHFAAGSDNGAITAGVHEVYLNWASTLSPRCLLGAFGIAWTTRRAWCESNITDPNPYPDEGEWAGVLPVAGALSVPTDGPRDGRLVAVSDPSLFNNDMWDRGDNARFAMNIIDWLTNGDPDIPVVFCEHLLEVPVTSAEFFYGIYLSRALWMTTQPLLAPMYPMVTLVGIKKYLPDMKKPEVRSVSEVFLRRGQTYFSERLQYYRTEGNYARVVRMIYRKLRRDIRRTYMWSDFDVAKVWEIMHAKDPSLKQSDFFRTIERIEEISSKSGMKIRENELMNLFFFMRDISAKLVESRM